MEDIQLMVETGLEAYRFSISWPRLIPNGRGAVNPKGLEYYNNLISELIRHGYQGRQEGFVGINVFAYWYIPSTNATEDVIATQRANDFYIGWIINPLVFGDYPKIVKNNAGSRILEFTKVESKLVKGSFDFLGVNNYNTLYIKDKPSSLKINNRDFNADMAIDIILVSNDTPPDEFPITPSGLLGVLEYFKQFYGNPPIYIHENGQQTQRNSTLHDSARVKYLHGFIGSLLDAVSHVKRDGNSVAHCLARMAFAMEDFFIWMEVVPLSLCSLVRTEANGSNARGYFTWSFLDVYELLGGYRSCFGLYYVDLDDKDLKRYPKLSAHWYSNF
ncbi:unnamed protein product [Camellia sinensis]